MLRGELLGNEKIRPVSSTVRKCCARVGSSDKLEWVISLSGIKLNNSNDSGEVIALRIFNESKEDFITGSQFYFGSD